MQGEEKDLLFFTTERYKFCVLYWDADSKQLFPIDLETCVMNACMPLSQDHDFLLAAQTTCKQEQEET